MDRAREPVNATSPPVVERGMGDPGECTTAARTTRRRRWRLPASVGAAVLSLSLLAGGLPAGAQTSDGTDGSGSGETESIDVLTATREEVRAALAQLEERHAAQRAEVDRAERAVEEANLAVERAEARVALAEHEVELARETVAEYAVEAYMRPPAQDTLRVLSLTEADDAAYASSVIRILTEERHKVVDVLVDKRAEADRERATAAEAAEHAEGLAEEAQRKLVELDRMRAEQQDLAATLDDRLDAALAEAAALVELDRQMSEELAAQELALRNSGPSSPPRAQPAADRPAPRPTSPPPTARPPSTPRPPTTRPPSSGGPGTVTWSDVTSVGGIWVHTSIASNVRALLNAATAAGLSLDGGGYRDPQAQIDTRRNNCGPTYYDIYEKPSNQCSPPTARPGRSMHERGLAMDLRSNGSLITSRSNPAFVWLAANASRYGFYNLPSEPWHWSTNGN